MHAHRTVLYTHTHTHGNIRLSFSLFAEYILVYNTIQYTQGKVEEYRALRETSLIFKSNTSLKQIAEIYHSAQSIYYIIT